MSESEAPILTHRVRGRAEDAAGDQLLIKKSNLARMLDVSGRTLQRWAREGRMPPPVVGGEAGQGVALWNAQAVRDWIRGGCQPVAQEAGDER
ncbi:MAG: helix-turn-helix transcriptional regulator [Phycisphaeraceae bacterium]